MDLDISITEENAANSTSESPERRLKLSSFASQTTPGLLQNGLASPDGKIEESSPQKIVEDDSDDEQSCPICLEPWTNSGSHRLVSLDCGHLFGRNCVEKWLKDQKQKCCPQCKKRAKRSDVRNIYAKALKVYDTSEAEHAKNRLREERYKRARAEEGEAKALLQYQILKQEMEKLKKQVEEQTSNSCASISSTCCNDRSVSLHSSQSQSNLIHSMSSPDLPANQRTITKSFTSQKSLQVSNKEARVMAYDAHNLLMIISKPSPNQLFPGYGILKVSSLESRSSEYIRIHQKQIRDAKFNNSGDQLVLTGSVDKTLKITSALSNSTVQCYSCPAPVWACCWNENDLNYVYSGLQNGTCMIYDIRKTDQQLDIIKPRVGNPCPIVSLSYVSASNEDSTLRCGGLLVGTLQGGWFIQRNEDTTHTDHQLLFPEGSCSNLIFEPMSRHCLLSQRPGKNCSRVSHSICELSGNGSQEDPVKVKCIQQCYGGSRAQSLTRSTLFACPDDPSSLLIAAGDEASSSVIVWDVWNRGKEHQKLQEGGVVFDLMTFKACGSTFLATLTEQKLHFYQWL